jgi:uncharacterized protein
MSEQDNIRVVQQAYENFKTGNIQALLGLMSEDIEWNLPAIENVSFSGKRRGRAAVGEFFASLAGSQEPIEFAPEEFIAQGDKVVSLGHYRWRVKETGREYAGDFAHVFTVRNGSVVGFQEYMDTALAAAAHQKALNA